MRSRFWLGEIDPVQTRKPPPEVLKEKVPDDFDLVFLHIAPRK